MGSCEHVWLCLDVREQCLLRGERRLRLTPRAFALLYLLVQQPRVALTKEQLLHGAWSGMAVEPGQVKQLVCVLRALLHDDPVCPRFIETVRGRGYRYLGGIAVVEAAASPQGYAATMVGHGRVNAAAEVSPPGTAASPSWQQAAQRLLQGQRVLCVMHGDAGTARPVLAALGQDDTDKTGPALVLTARCAPACSDEDFSALLDTLDELCSAPQAQELRQLVRCFAPSWALQLPWCFNPAETGALNAPPAGPLSTGRMRREFGRLLQELALRQPVVLCVLDAQDADVATRRLLDYLAMQATPARLLLLVTTQEPRLAQTLIAIARRYSSQLVLS